MESEAVLPPPHSRSLADLFSWAAADLRLDGVGKPWEQMYRAWLRLSAADRLRLETALLPVNDLSVSDARDRLGELAEQTWSAFALARGERPLPSRSASAPPGSGRRTP